MFNFKLGQSTDVDLSSELLDVSDFTPERLLTLEYAHDVAIQAFDPLTGLVAIGRLLCPIGHRSPAQCIEHPSSVRIPYLHQELAQVLCG